MRRGLADQSQRARPEPFRQNIECACTHSDEALNLIDVADDDQNRFGRFPALQLFDSLDRAAIQRVRAQAVERVGAKGDDAAARDRFSDSGKRFGCLRNDHRLLAPSGAEYL